MKILVVEDYMPLRESIVQALQEEGYAVDETGDGREGLWHAENNQYDVVLLDIMLPELDGLSILRTLRSHNNSVHVLIMTARDAVEDRVGGLDLGADDYLVKPFAPAELLARVRALVRRKYDTKSPVMRFGDLEIDTSGRVVRRSGQVIELHAREYALLEFLASRHGRVTTRDEIWEHIYDFNAEPGSNVLDVYVGTLRKKLEANGGSRLIQTRRGLGYVFEDRQS